LRYGALRFSCAKRLFAGKHVGLLPVTSRQLEFWALEKKRHAIIGFWLRFLHEFLLA
jgi:hypothetical protein